MKDFYLEPTYTEVLGGNLHPITDISRDSQKTLPPRNQSILIKYWPMGGEITHPSTFPLQKMVSEIQRLSVGKIGSVPKSFKIYHPAFKRIHTGCRKRCKYCNDTGNEFRIADPRLKVLDPQAERYKSL